MIINLLEVNFDPHLVQANLVCACIPAHCYQHLRNKETDGLVLMNASICEVDSASPEQKGKKRIRKWYYIILIIS